MGHGSQAQAASSSMFRVASSFQDEKLYAINRFMGHGLIGVLARNRRLWHFHSTAAGQDTFSFHLVSLRQRPICCSQIWWEGPKKRSTGNHLKATWVVSGPSPSSFLIQGGEMKELGPHHAPIIGLHDGLTRTDQTLSAVSTTFLYVDSNRKAGIRESVSGFHRVGAVLTQSVAPDGLGALPPFVGKRLNNTQAPRARIALKPPPPAFRDRTKESFTHV